MLPSTVMLSLCQGGGQQRGRGCWGVVPATSTWIRACLGQDTSPLISAGSPPVHESHNVWWERAGRAWAVVEHSTPHVWLWVNHTWGLLSWWRMAGTRKIVPFLREEEKSCSIPLGQRSECLTNTLYLAHALNLLNLWWPLRGREAVPPHTTFFYIVEHY